MKRTFNKDDVVCIIDVEATRDREVYDIGIVVYSISNDEVLHASGYIVSDVFMDSSKMSKSFFAKKVFTKYPSILYDDMRYDLVSFKDARNTINGIIETYKVNVITAYNITYDASALGATTREFIGEDSVFISSNKPIEYCDIYYNACVHICDTNKYRKFALKHGLVSTTGNIQTSAEAVFKYITNNPSFEEDHTGLNDALDVELPILKTLIKRKRKLFFNTTNTSAWKIPQIKET